MEHHIYLVYAHLLLFAYWLAPDWGVYVTSSYVARADLPLEERRRFLQAALRIDLVPRSCLIALLPLGLLAQMTTDAPLPAGLSWGAAGINLLWSTLGNVIGGGALGLVYWAVYLRGK